MHVLTDLCYLLEDEVGQVVKKGELTPTELDNVYKAVKTMNYIEIIKAMKKDEDRNSGYAYGRYARHSKDEKIAELERMMENASTEAERRAFMEAIRSIDK